MDDDLFGGLPAVSKTENDLFGGLPAVSKTGEVAKSAAVSDEVGNNSTSTPANVGSGVEKVTEKRKVGASLVSSLGTAGTSMAFVPLAIRKKKKKLPQQPQPRSSQQQQTSDKQHIVTEKSVSESQTNNVASTALQQIGLVKSEFKSDYDGAHQISNRNKDQSIANHNPLNDSNSDVNAINEPYLENEPESLRLLHASVVNPYDPHFPNDYLAHRERKKTEQVRKDLQRSALQRLDHQEKLRKKIEEERKRMLESGDLDKLVESHAGGGDAASVEATRTSGGVSGRGRGRGVANLPAWLVKKQQEQKEAEMKSSDAKPISDGQFDDPAQS